MSSVDSETLLRVEEIPGRGRALVSSQPLRGGQIILRDSPILLYSALPLIKYQHEHQQSSSSSFYCDNCFRAIQPPASSAVSCPSCSHHHFCSPNCMSLATASSHSPWVCQFLNRLRDYPCLLLHQERQVQARFLISAYNLAIVSPSDFQILSSLQGHADDEEAVAAAQFLHPIISSLCPPPPPPIEGLSFSLVLTAALLAKDRLNAFGLMEPLGLLGEGQRSVRAYGIYPKAAMFNHDCLPNACRFDYVDSAPDRNTDIIVRMIHDVPQGREICLSYFPVNLNYSTRQKRLLEDYGFTCDCDRCKVEANWSDDGGGGGGCGDENEVMEEDQDESMEAVSDGEDDNNNNNEEDFPHAYFFLRYMCNRDNCGGTLAPLPPASGNPSHLLECNVCGNMKNNEVVDADGGQDGLSMDQ